MLLPETEDNGYHKVANFRGYMQVPGEVFEQITPFLLTDQEKMHALLRDVPVSLDKPKWLDQLPHETEEGAVDWAQGVECYEWSGYIIIEEEPEGGIIEEAVTASAGQA